MAPFAERFFGREHGAERCVADAPAFPGFAVRLDHELAECPLVRSEDPEALCIGGICRVEGSADRMKEEHDGVVLVREPDEDLLGWIFRAS
jgi:hypothetical protein